MTTDSPPNATPLNWYITEGNKQVSLGWYWQRKEIENYLIDPKVVRRTLGDDAPLFANKLDKAQALRQAMLKLKDKYPNNPKKWAAFTLIGEAE